jgi:hypothetical protein
VSIYAGPVVADDFSYLKAKWRRQVRTITHQMPSPLALRGLEFIASPSSTRIHILSTLPKITSNFASNERYNFNPDSFGTNQQIALHIGLLNRACGCTYPLPKHHSMLSISH